jgi:antitoxin ParD1/3/4
MSTVEKISIALPREMASQLKQAVLSGSYSSASEVVREALRDWKDKQDQKEIVLKEFRRMWREGAASGPGRFSSMDEIKAEAKRQFELRKSSV